MAMEYSQIFLLFMCTNTQIVLWISDCLKLWLYNFKKLSIFSVEESKDKLVLCLDIISVTKTPLVNVFSFPDVFVVVKFYVCWRVL